MKKTPIGFIRAYCQARQVINDFKPDVIHSHMVHANLFSRMLRLFMHIPKLICTAHSSNEGGRSRMLAYRITDSLCDLNTNVSQEAVDISVQRGAAPAERIIAMHNGIDTERFIFNSASRVKLRAELGLAENSRLLLAVGRLTQAKDYPNLFTAFTKLSELYDDVQLAVIGEGDEQAALTVIVTELGLTSRVHFLGLRRDVHEWMSAADVFVLSSAWEGFGLVVAEAMACERVVVATDCGGVKEVIGDCGILVPAKNSTALAQGLIQALALNAEVSSELGGLARKRVMNFYSLSTQVKSWINLYRQ